MNEDVLAAVVRCHETESFFDVVPFKRTETFLRRSPSWPWRGRTPSLAHRLSSTPVHLKDFSDTRALLPQADPDLQTSPIGQAAMAAASNAREGRNASDPPARMTNPKPLSALNHLTLA